jgi:hypothetical protein
VLDDFFNLYPTAGILIGNNGPSRNILTPVMKAGTVSFYNFKNLTPKINDASQGFSYFDIGSEITIEDVTDASKVIYTHTVDNNYSFLVTLVDSSVKIGHTYNFKINGQIFKTFEYTHSCFDVFLK